MGADDWLRQHLTESLDELEDAALTAAALAVAPIATAVLDAEGRIRSANRAFAELTGRLDDTLVGVPLNALVVAGHRLLVRSALGAGRPGRPPLDPPVVRLAPDSAERWAQLHAAPLPPPRTPARGLADAAEEPVQLTRPAGFVVQLVDVTAQRLQERRLRDLAFRDPLTQVLSRRGIERAIANFCEQVEREERPGALLAIDLDRFKDVNDTLGHPVGDTVLARVAAEMRRRLRARDVVGRLGGDEFVVLLPSCRAVDAQRVADDILAGVSSDLRRPDLTPGRDDGRLHHVPAGRDRPGAPPAGDDPLAVTASIGIAIFDRGRRADDVVAAADRALYEAKRRGGDCWAMDPGPGAPSQHRDAMRPDEPTIDAEPERRPEHAGPGSLVTSGRPAGG